MSAPNLYYYSASILSRLAATNLRQAVATDLNNSPTDFVPV